MVQPLADFHIHTIFSGHAFSTLQEVICAALQRGLTSIAITDHGPARPDGPKLDYFKNLLRQDSLRLLPGLRVLIGVEANIINSSGDLDVPDKLLSELDVVIVGFHNATGYGGSSRAENTNALMRTLKRHRVNIVSHIGDPRFPFPVELEEPIAAASEKGVLVELNQSALHRWKPENVAHYDSVLTLLEKYHSPILMSSDAHISYAVGVFAECERLLREHGRDPVETVNYSESLVDKYFKRIR